MFVQILSIKMRKKAVKKNVKVAELPTFGYIFYIFCSGPSIVEALGQKPRLLSLICMNEPGYMNSRILI